MNRQQLRDEIVTLMTSGKHYPKLETAIRLLDQYAYEYAERVKVEAKAEVLLSLLDKRTSPESYRRLKREAEHIANDQLWDLQQQLNGNPKENKRHERAAKQDDQKLREKLKEKLGILRFGFKYWDYIIGVPSLGGKYPYPAAQEELDRITDDFLALIHSERERASAETAKAYGGCTNCYGKGYATHRSAHTGIDTDQDIGSPGVESMSHLKRCGSVSATGGGNLNV